MNIKWGMGSGFILFLFFVVLSCEQPVGDGGGKQPKTGYVTLSLAGVTDEAEARTIMPATPSPGDFKRFRLWFTHYTTKTETIVYRTMANLEEPVELEIGEYELAVTAYLDAECTKPAAHIDLKGANRIVIDKGTGSKYVITLSAIINDVVIDDPENDDKPAQGVFRWVIPCNFIESAVTASMRIVSLADSNKVYNVSLLNGQGGTSLTGSLTLTGEYTLPVGYYNVSITLNTTVTVNGESYLKSATIRDILHVYRYLESVLNDMVFSDEIFDRNYYTVTFNYNNRSTAPSPATVAYGKTRSKPATDPLWAGSLYIFDGWYSDAQCTTLHDFSEPVYDNLNVYAKWLGNMAQATVTIAGNVTNTYNGEAQSPSYTVYHDGKMLLVGNEFTFTASDNTNAGTASFTIAAIGGGSYTGSKGGTFTIQKKPVTVSKVYDGATTTAGATLDGVVSGDSVAVSAGTGAFADKNVGTKPITLTGSLTGADAGNYTLAATGTITPKPVTITATANNKVYNGTTTATVGSSTINGVISGDTVTIDVNNAAFADRNAGTNKPVTFSGFSLGGADARNYYVSGQPTATATISQKDINLSVPTVQGKVYDGNTTAMYSGTPGLLADNLITGDDVRLSPSSPSSFTNVSFQTKNAGTNKIVVVGVDSFSLAGADAPNYVLRAGNFQTDAAITPKDVTVTGVSVPTKPYDGSPLSVNTATATIVGKIATDTVTVAADPGDRNAGEKTVTLSLTGADAPNYNLTTTTVTGTISQKSVTVTASVQSSKSYDGSTSAIVTSSTVIGVISGDSVSATGNANYADANIGTNKVVTFSGFVLTGADRNNYSLSGQPASVQASIDRVTPNVVWPSTSEGERNLFSAWYGQTLADVSITGYGLSGWILSSNSGTFSWTNPNASVGAVGKRTHNMTFTPTDTTNYSTINADVDVYVVAKPEMKYVAGGSGVNAFYISNAITWGQYYRVISPHALNISGSIHYSASNENVFSSNPASNYLGNNRDVYLFLNWLSELDGLTPVYTINGLGYDATVTATNLNNSGYRLPTPAELTAAGYTPTTYDDVPGYTSDGYFMAVRKAN